jgi:hypothetical protein
VTLRELLIQRAARLQDYPALTAAPWGELRYPAFRNRVEGVALGLVMTGRSAFHCATGSPWDWAAEVACACCGYQWQAGEPGPDPAILGGTSFNHDHGRQVYHDRDHDVTEATPFTHGLTHGELLTRLRRLNGKLGWDHATAIKLPLGALGTPEVRAALWSALYGGSHALLVPGAPTWDPEPFRTFWS